MKIVEYKKHAVSKENDPDGVKDPAWIHKGGFFFNSEDNTFVGLVLNESDRLYYVPETVVELTPDELKTRCKHIQTLHPVKPFTKDGNDMSDTEIESFIDEWINEKI